MRTFLDDTGASWVASVRERDGDDYKGRYWFVLTPEDPATKGEEVELIDVRWNSLKTAKRTLLTMSETELRRRLRSAAGRGA
jgi:hypothetical protein